MKNMDAAIIAAWTGGTLRGEALCDGVSVDSRKVNPNDCFICLKGERVDGHDYAQKAVDSGASLLLVDHFLADVSCAQICVPDTLEGLRIFARSYRETLSALFIGITGSNGKTSTKDILHSILKNVGSTIATYKNQNTEIGSYLTLFRMNEDTEFGIFEMGLDYVGDVARMAEMVRPHAGLLMSLAPAHMMNFNDIHHIASEKMRIFDYVQSKDLSFYQGDFEAYRRISDGQHTFGFNSDNDVIVGNVSSSNEGIRFEVDGVVYSSNLLGAHQASNCAGVIALMQALEVDDAAIRLGLNHVELTSLRTELVEKGASLVLLDAYKSNPISARYALDLLAHYDTPRSRIAVLSDMVELGPESDAAHVEVLEWILGLDSVSKVYTLGPEFKKAMNTLDVDSNRFMNDLDFETFKNRVIPLFETEAMILIKGSRSYQLERLMEEGK